MPPDGRRLQDRARRAVKFPGRSLASVAFAGGAQPTIREAPGRLKDAVDSDSVRDDLTQVVSRALEPAHLSVWISHRD